METQQDPRVVAFREYLSERIAEQDRRPYGEREDIERALEMYKAIERQCNVMQRYETCGAAEPQTINTSSEMPIGEFCADMRPRARRVLQSLGIVKLRELTQLTEREMRRRRDCGDVTFNEIEQHLASYGLSFKSEED